MSVNASNSLAAAAEAQRSSRGSSSGILLLLWGFAFLSYLLRMNIAIAQQYMSRELHLSDLQIGSVFSAFLIGYTIFQVPAGLLGDRFGPRLVLAVSALTWAVTTFLTGLAPGLLVTGAFAPLLSLLVLRFLHGIGQAATYPVAMTAVSEWYSPARHAFVSSVIFTGSTLGSAFAPPLVAYIMSALGWRATFYITAVLPALLAGLWWIKAGKQPQWNSVPKRSPDASRLPNWRLALKRSVLFLCLSYFLYCYTISIFVYWLFKYLVDVRHLSIVNSGWANSLPWIVASVAVPLFGYLSTRLSRRVGILSSRRAVAVGCLLVSALLLFAGAGSENIGIALAAIAVSVGLLFSTESSYWSTAIEVAHDDAGAASGLMNLAGNLGGVLATTLVPVLVHSFGWFNALLSGSVFALAAAAVWFLIR